MRYRLTLEATNQKFHQEINAYDLGESHEADVELSFPVDATFSTNMLVGNALRELIPILLGEVVQKFDHAEMLEEEERLGNVVEKVFPTEG
jgi:hypothetical protein